MNRIYRRQVGIVFGSAGVNPSLNMSNIRPKKGGFNNVGIPVILGGKTPEEEAIVNHRKTDVLFNVFFVGDIVDLSNALSGDPGDDFLAVTSFSAHAGLGLGRFLRNLVGPPGRCCLLRDLQKRDDGKAIHFGQVLAHECGHALDEDDITDPSKRPFDVLQRIEFNGYENSVPLGLRNDEQRAAIPTVSIVTWF